MTHYTGTAGDDVITGTKRGDKFDMSQGGNDTLHGGGGDDYFYFGAALNAGDSIDGGVGRHQVLEATVELKGDYSAGVLFGAATMINVAHLILDAGFGYNLTLNETTVGAAQTMEIDASKLGAGDTLILDDSAGDKGQIKVTSNAGHTTIIGGTGNDIFVLGGTLDATDHIDGGGGSNTLSIAGNYTGSVLLDGSAIAHINTLQAGAGSYNFTETDAFLAAGQRLTIQGASGVSLNFDGSAELDGAFSISNVTGTILGGGGADVFSHITGPVDGGGGDDQISFVANQTVNGGDGNDTIDSCSGTMNGANGNDTISNSSGTFDGGAGNDFFNRDTGTFAGGDGDDFFSQCTGTFDPGTGSTGFSLCSGTFNLQQSDIVTYSGATNAVNVLNMGAALKAGDRLDGTNSTDTVLLDGDYSAGMVFAGTMSNIDTLLLAAGHSYAFTADNFLLSKQSAMVVDGTALGDGDFLHFDGSAAAGGFLTLKGGDGDDVLIGGQRSSTLIGGHGQDTLTGNNGNDHLTGGGGRDILDGGAGGNDHFHYLAVTDSVGIHYDTIDHFDVTRDHIDAMSKVTGIDAMITAGALDGTNGNVFANELAAAVDAAHLAASHAVLFTPDSGSLAGHVFLVIDQNGIAGYQVNGDLVIEMQDGMNLGSLSIHNFG